MGSGDLVLITVISSHRSDRPVCGARCFEANVPGLTALQRVVSREEGVLTVRSYRGDWVLAGAFQLHQFPLERQQHRIYPRATKTNDKQSPRQ